MSDQPASSDFPDASVQAPSAQEVAEELRRLRRSVRRLTVLTALLTLAVFLCSAAVFGELVNYFSFDPILYGGVAAGAAVLGFVFGFVAGRR
jgi:membrane associated rhomboid family serine protease